MYYVIKMSNTELDGMLMHIQIYKAKQDTPYLHLDLSDALNNGFSESHYEVVYDTHKIFLNTDKELELFLEIYDHFRKSTGQMLEVSDIIVIDDEAYYINHNERQIVDWSGVDSENDVRIRRHFWKELNTMINESQSKMNANLESLKSDTTNLNPTNLNSLIYHTNNVAECTERTKALLEVRDKFLYIVRNFLDIYERSYI